MKKWLILNSLKKERKNRIEHLFKNNKTNVKIENI